MSEQNYSVTLIYDASETVKVQAETPEEAEQRAYEKSLATLCHQCANHLDLGDATAALVYDENGEEVADSSMHAKHMEAVKALEALKASHGALLKAARDVLAHREGELPIKGWLRDNDASRQALGKLAEVVVEGEQC